MSLDDAPKSSQDGLPAATKAALQAAGDCVYIWHLDTDQVEWLDARRQNAEAALLRQISRGQDYLDHIHPEDAAHRSDCLARHLSGQRDHYFCEYRIALPDGHTIWVEDRGCAHEENGQKKLYSTLRLVTERKENEARLHKLAHYDELTNLFNAAHLREALDHSLAYTKRYNTRGMYMVVGIDNLSLINNALGNRAADEVIVEVARRIEKLLAITDVIGRVGGDHFGVIVNHLENRDERAFLENILATVNASAIDTDQGKVGVTVSIGVAQFIIDGTTSHDIIARAEIALQAAKRSGRNCVTHYRVHLQPLVSNSLNLSISEEVRGALREGRFCLAFQPVVSAKTGQTYFHECLARIRRPDGTILAAGSFIPAAEQMGLMREIDDHVVKLAVDELRKDKNLRLAVNISGFNVGNGSWLQHLRGLLAPSPEAAKRLMIEITETAALSDIREAAHFVNCLKDMGCMVALDDFGAGYTSYRQLRLLPVNLVKIDGSFVGGVSNNVGNQLFVRTLVELANGFGLDTIAECVETKEDADLLTSFGVSFLQGLYFARPDARATPRTGPQLVSVTAS